MYQLILVNEVLLPEFSLRLLYGTQLRNPEQCFETLHPINQIVRIVSSCGGTADRNLRLRFGLAAAQIVFLLF